MEHPSFEFRVRWSDLDGNNHVANSSYLDYVTECRMLYLESAGFPPSEFTRLNIGPVVLNDYVEYRKELLQRDWFKVTIALAGMNAKKSRFIFMHRFLDKTGDLCVSVRSMFVFIDRAARKTIVPPDHLMTAMVALPRDESWQDL